MLKPETVAILGASSNKNKLGYLQVKALLDGGFQGDIYPINPNADMIEGLRCYHSLADVPKQVDLAVFCVSAANAEECLMDCAKNKVKSIILFASGYSEVGEKGFEKQERLRKIAEDNGIRLLGPNCVGLVNTVNGLVCTFSPGLTELPLKNKREVGFITQSGAFGVLTYIAAAQAGLTFNYFVSVGNEAETGFSDLVEYMIDDPETSVISGYLEGEKNPDRLRRLATKALDVNKPIVIMKSGRSSAGSRAAVSHTGSLAGSDKIYDGFFKQTNIVRAEDYDDIISFSKLFQAKKLPKGRNTVIITSSGGRGINEADRCEAYGLHIHKLQTKTRQKIEQRIPSFASAANPIDLTAAAAVTNPELFIEPLKALVEDKDVDIIMFSEFPMNWDADSPYLQEFIEICSSTDKLVFITTFPLEGMAVPAGTDELEKNGIPVITGDLNPVRALAKLVDYSERYRQTKQEKGNEFPGKKTETNVSKLMRPGATLSESEASEVLESYGIPITKRQLAITETEAVKCAEEIGYPVVLKIDSPDIPHKSDANAIQLNVTGEQAVRTAYREVLENAANYKPDAKVNGVSVQQMLPQGVEVICGVSNDPTFGPVIMFGLGGVFVEVFEDIAFRVAPITKQDAIDMITETKGYQVLRGIRGKPAADIDAIADVLMRVSALASDYKHDINELDINPLIVYEQGIVAADAMLTVKETENLSSVAGGK
nr:acetate--CoA ligase family protein [Virgibacillus phasianinus]